MPLKRTAGFLALGLYCGANFWGCASTQYRYLASDENAVCLSPKNGATYVLPLEARQGEVRITSNGVADLSPKKSEPKVRVLQLRMIVENTQKNSLLSVKPGEQFVVFPSHKPLGPAWVNTDTTNPPPIGIEPGKTRTLDFYFNIPDDLKSADKIPAFNFNWIVHTRDRTETRTTAFERYAVPNQVAEVVPYSPYPYDYPYGFGWGPVWYRQHEWW